MLLAMFSDIHGNLEALQVARDLMKQTQPNMIVCIGDLVGYGANPRECIRISRELASVCIAGNHDYAVAGKMDTSYFAGVARIAIQWTSNQLDQDEKDYLANLPLKHEFAGYLFVHASPKEPIKWEYVTSDLRAKAAFSSFNKNICFIGHSHYPYVWVDGESGFYPEPNQVYELEKSKKYIINIGSVGQPRDNNPDGSIALFDSDRYELTVIRFKYDIKITQKKIIKAGLPQKLASRLELGV